MKKKIRWCKRTTVLYFLLLDEFHIYLFIRKPRWLLFYVAATFFLLINLKCKFLLLLQIWYWDDEKPFSTLTRYFAQQDFKRIHMCTYVCIDDRIIAKMKTGFTISIIIILFSRSMQILYNKFCVFFGVAFIFLWYEWICAAFIQTCGILCST